MYWGGERIGKLSEEMTAENFPNLRKTIDPQVQEAQPTISTCIRKSTEPPHNQSP